MELAPDDNHTCSLVWLQGLNSFDWGYGMMDRGIIHDEGSGFFDEDSHASSDFGKFKKQLLSCCEEYDDEQISDLPLSSGHNKCLHRMGIIACVTNHLQEVAEGHLERLGFIKTGPFSKLKHSNTKISMWVMHPPAFMEAVGYEGILAKLGREEIVLDEYEEEVQLSVA